MNMTRRQKGRNVGRAILKHITQETLPVQHECAFKFRDGISIHGINYEVTCEVYEDNTKVWIPIFWRWMIRRKIDMLIQDRVLAALET